MERSRYRNLIRINASSDVLQEITNKAVRRDYLDIEIENVSVAVLFLTSKLLNHTYHCSIEYQGSIYIPMHIYDELDIDRWIGETGIDAIYNNDEERLYYRHSIEVWRYNEAITSENIFLMLWNKTLKPYIESDRYESYITYLARIYQDTFHKLKQKITSPTPFSIEYRIADIDGAKIVGKIVSLAMNIESSVAVEEDLSRSHSIWLTPAGFTVTVNTHNIDPRQVSHMIGKTPYAYTLLLRDEIYIE